MITRSLYLKGLLLSDNMVVSICYIAVFSEADQCGIVTRMGDLRINFMVAGTTCGPCGEISSFKTAIVKSTYILFS